jgi:hypothetical protein
MVACMAVMARERWTDEQLDKAFGRVDGDLREIRVELRKGFEQIDQRFEQMEKRFDKVDERFDKVDERFDKVDERFDKVDERFDKVNQRFEKVDERFDRVATWLVSLSCTIIGSLVAGLVASQAFVSRNLRALLASRSARVATQIACCVSCGSRTCC